MGATEKGHFHQPGFRSWFLFMLMVLFLGGSALAGDIIRLKNGKTIEGKIISVTPKVVTIKLDSGTMRLPREQIKVIQREQDKIAPPPPPTDGKAPTGKEGKKNGRDPEPGEEGWKPTTEDGNSVEKPAEEKAPDRAGEKSKAPGTDKKAKPKVTGKKSTKVPALKAKVQALQQAEESADDVIAALLQRYVWVIPDSPGNRISLGVGLLFILTMILHFAGKLADVEDISLPRSLMFSMVMILVAFLQVALLKEAEWPMIAGAGCVNVLLWYSGVKAIMREGFWRGSVMLAFFFLALLLCVLWVEVAGFVLAM